MDFNKPGNLVFNEFSDSMLPIIKAVFTDVVFLTPGLNGLATVSLFEDHSDPLLRTDLGNKLIHKDAFYNLHILKF